MRYNVTVVIDRSGSMQTGRADHEGGLKSFVNSQKSQEGETVFNLVQFDSYQPFDIVHNEKNIKDVDIDSYQLIPRGGTPLLDAVGKTIALVEEQEKNKKSDQVVLMIITDGEENKSVEWTKDALKNSIEKHKDDWTILFLGANIDAFATGHSYGMKTNCVINVNNAAPQNVANMYGMVANKVNLTRSMRSRGESEVKCSSAMNFTAEDYASQDEWVDNSTGKNAVS